MGTRVAVQHQQRLFREGLGQLLAAEDDIEVCATVGLGVELQRVCAEETPALILLEADTSSWDVPRLCAVLRRADPDVLLIGMSARPTTPADVSAARRAGMSAVVPRLSGIAGILDVLRAAVATPRRGQISVLLKSSSAGAPVRSVLTTRELHVLHLVGAGYRSREISGRLGISHKTVENHKQRIFGKLGVQNQAHAVSVAMRTGLLRADQVIDLAVGD